MQGSITALVTPFNATGKVDFLSLRTLIERQIESGTDALVICGTTGEIPTLTNVEQLEIITESVRIAAKRILIIAGTGSSSTEETMQRTRAAMQAGADSALVAFPYFNRPTFFGIRKHFEELATLGFPLILYHHPSRTGVHLGAKQLAALLEIPEVIAIKEGSGELELAIELMSMTKKPVLCGDDSLTIPYMAAGAKGIISIISNVIPKEWKQFVDYCLAGDFSSARSLFYQNYALCKSMVLETNPQCVKYALSLMGLCGSSLRLPMIEPQEVTQEAIRKELELISNATANT